MLEDLVNQFKLGYRQSSAAMRYVFEDGQDVLEYRTTSLTTIKDKGTPIEVLGAVVAFFKYVIKHPIQTYQINRTLIRKDILEGDEYD